MAARTSVSGIHDQEIQVQMPVSGDLERFHQPYSAKMHESVIEYRTGLTMRLAGKLVGAASVGVLGSLIFLAPNNVTPDRIASGGIVATAAHAEQSGPMARHLSKINAADDAYFKAAIAIEAAGESPERLAALKKADDQYFDAVMSFEVANSQATQIAKVEAADDAYFKAAMALEASQRQAQRLAEMKVQEQIVAQQDADDQIVTASVPGKADPIASNLANVKAADDAYFDAVIALETSGENPEDLKKLKDADDAYFSAVIALEDAYAKQVEAKKAGKSVKVAAAATPVSDASPAKPVEKAAVHAAPLPPKKQWSNQHVVKKTYRPVHTATIATQPYYSQPAGPLSLIYNIVTYPVRVIVGGTN